MFGGIVLTDKKLRKLKRYQLLELLVMQTEENEKLQDQLKELEARYKEKELGISNLGSIAEASLQINGVFDAAQNAADMYLRNAKAQADEIIKAAHLRAKEITVRAESKYSTETLPDSFYADLSDESEND